MDSREEIRNRGLRIAILSGGNGSEREVSLVSGRSVQTAIRNLDLPCDLFELEANRLPGGLHPRDHLVLPLIHGQYGEDGQLSAELEAGGFAYCGCSRASSVLCYDKLACKALAARQGIPVARDVRIPSGPLPSYADLRAQLGERFILKPRRDGSSVGLFLVDSPEKHETVAASWPREDSLAEAYIEGVDLTVGILGGEPLGIVAVYPEGGLYDYAHKYTRGKTRYEVPAAVSGAVKASLFSWSRDVFELCGCRDLARIDFRLGASGEAAFLEINTLPGMTPTSLLPMTASCAGIDFPNLVLRCIECALARRLPTDTP